jgi:hypothetical protein
MQNERSRHLREIEELNKKHQQEVAELSRRLEIERLEKQDLEKQLQEVEHFIKQKGRNEVLGIGTVADFRLILYGRPSEIYVLVCALFVR